MKEYLLQDIKVLKQTIISVNDDLALAFETAAWLMIEALKAGNKIIICGNGGSAADAEHMAGEIVGRFGFDRASLPCISLCTPSATFTAIANDYGYENVFARQVSGLGKADDILIGLSTSGNSKNVIAAMQTASKMGIKTIAMTGAKDSELSEMAHITLRSPSIQTPRIQEIHGTMIHSLCKAIENEIFPEKASVALPSNKVISEDNLEQFIEAIKPFKTVFTNGCFDIIHPGHIYLLEEARSAGELLILGLNTDDSIKRLKGPTRPHHAFANRAKVLSAIETVDYIVGFSDDTPKKLIEALTPTVLVKGGDYTRETIVGADWVEDHGGEILVIPTLEGHSTTGILNNNE